MQKIIVDCLLVLRVYSYIFILQANAVFCTHFCPDLLLSFLPNVSYFHVC